MEKILNIYMVITDGVIQSFRAIDYTVEGDDYEKIDFLKTRAKDDFVKSIEFEGPVNRWGKLMKYSQFAKFEKQGLQFDFMEEIFKYYKLGEHPLVCVTPVVDGKIN